MIDSHAHVICRDPAAYPLFKPTPEKLQYLAEHAFEAADLCKAMDETGVERALIVQRGQFYGADNSYVCAAAAASEGRLRAVCGIDSLSGECAQAAEHWMQKGAAGLRIMGRPGGESMDWLGGDNAQLLWQSCADRGTVLCCHLFGQSRDEGIPIIERMLDRYPLQTLVIDHLTNTPIGNDGQSGIDDHVRRLADRPNVALKFTTIPLGTLEQQGIDAGAVLKDFGALFGADRLLWGSDVTQSAGSYDQHVALARNATANMPDDIRDALLGGTTARIYGW